MACDRNGMKLRRGFPSQQLLFLTLGLLGDLYRQLGDEGRAEEAYKLLGIKYPGQAPLRGAVGMARLAVSRGDWEAAKRLVAPIAEMALQDRRLSLADGLAYSRAFYVLGQIGEHENELPGALRDHLRTVTIFRD